VRLGPSLLHSSQHEHLLAIHERTASRGLQGAAPAAVGAPMAPACPAPLAAQLRSLARADEMRERTRKQVSSAARDRSDESSLMLLGRRAAAPD
jgi:hypothetical protein